jgi:hypothetical protein
VPVEGPSYAFSPAMEKWFLKEDAGIMPASIDPPLADDEIECGRCGAHFYFELTRCPNCGVNVYEPDDDGDTDRPQVSSRQAFHRRGLFTRLDDLFRRVTKRPYPADELFGTSINQAELFDNLLVKVGGDRPTAERLVEFERQHLPQGNRGLWLQNAIRRWERDNRSRGVG